MINRLLFILILIISLPVISMAGGKSEVATSVDKSLGNYITVKDYTGKELIIEQPVTRVISINSGLSEILGALECTNLMVGRDSFSTFPSSLKYVQAVAKNSSSPNMEMMLSLEPDLVIADLMFDKSKRKIFESRGIPVIIESTSNPERLPVIVENFGKIFNKSDRANYIMSALTDTLSIVENGVLKLEIEDKPVVYYENRKPYKSASKTTGHHQFIVLAGGINIAADEPVSSPKLNPEFIIDRNPDIIIRRVSGDITSNAMKVMLESIYDRPSLQTVNAVIKKRVYIIKSDLFISLRYPVGVAYLASLFYGIDFIDINSLFKNFITAIYGNNEWSRIRETYVYPEK